MAAGLVGAVALAAVLTFAMKPDPPAGPAAEGSPSSQASAPAPEPVPASTELPTADQEGNATAATPLDPDLHPLLHHYLNETRRPAFLQALPDREHRHAWADTTFEVIPLSRYSLETMLVQRVGEHPDRILFQERGGADARAAFPAARGRGRRRS